jgi:hypothetical protein
MAKLSVLILFGTKNWGIYFFSVQHTEVLYVSMKHAPVLLFELGEDTHSAYSDVIFKTKIQWSFFVAALYLPLAALLGLLF